MGSKVFTLKRIVFLIFALLLISSIIFVVSRNSSKKEYERTSYGDVMKIYENTKKGMSRKELLTIIGDTFYMSRSSGNKGIDAIELEACDDSTCQNVTIYIKNNKVIDKNIEGWQNDPDSY